MRPLYWPRVVVVVALVGACAAGASAQDATFRDADRFSLPGTGSDATSVLTTADVGSLAGPPDGIPDIIQAGQNQRAAVLYGREDGFLLGGPNTILDRIPTALTLDDFTGDGFLDLLVADTGDKLVCYRGFSDGPPFEQQGDGRQVGDTPVAFETFDFNGDGDRDIAILNQGSQGFGEIWVLYGNGDCSFSPPPLPSQTIITTGRASSAFVLADFDDDGNPDFAVTNAADDDVVIFHGDADGGYSKVQTISVTHGTNSEPSQLVEPIAIEAADLDEDTNLDLVIVNRNADQVVVLDGRPDGTFAESRIFLSGSLGSSPTGLAVGDVNGDGHVDVVTANNRSSDASILLGDGHGQLARARSFMADQEPLNVVLAQIVPADAPKMMVLSRGLNTPNITVLGVDGVGVVNSIENVATDSSPSDFCIGDLDSDGLPDLAVAHSSGLVRLLRSTGNGGFEPMAADPLSLDGDVGVVVAADFDGDLVNDLVVAERDLGSISLFKGHPGNRFTMEQNIAVGAGISDMIVGDWNKDGRPDLAVARLVDEANGSVDILLWGEFGLGAPFQVASGISPVELDWGDFNADGILDIIVANNASGDVPLLLGDGDGEFSVVIAASPGDAARSIVVADFDRDSCDDFIVGLAMQGVGVPYFGNCDGTTQRGPQSLSLGTGAGARDFTGDGIPDVTLANEVDNMVVAVTKQTGSRFFFTGRNDRYIVSRRPIATSSADFDGDGRYDAAALNSFVAGSVSILSNVVAPTVMRGDANDDAAITAADLSALVSELGDGDSARIEEVGAETPSSVAVDANGDGLVRPTDARAIAAFVFSRS